MYKIMNKTLYIYLYSIMCYTILERKVIEMKIIPLSDLRNTSAISKMAMEESPVFVTKQGAAHMVIMSHEYFEEMQRKIKGQSNE